jgi:hypothetical protein
MSPRNVISKKEKTKELGRKRHDRNSERLQNGEIILSILSGESFKVRRYSCLYAQAPCHECVKQCIGSATFHSWQIGRDEIFNFNNE